MIEQRRHGQAYAHDGTAYWARCWYCDWTGPRHPRTPEGKSECKSDYALHDFVEERDVGPWERVPS